MAKGITTSTGAVTSCDPSSNGFTASANYVQDEAGHQLSEFDGSGNWVHTNVYASGELIATYNGVGLHFRLNDWLGTLRVQTDDAGNTELSCQSLPFGDPNTQCVNASENFFTGKERDAESGLDNFGARYYNSSTGRFLSPDPLNLTEARLLNPGITLNKYAYAADNPLKFVDPDGEDVTYFYDQGGIAGHAVLFAYNQDTGDSAIESFGPVVHAPIAPGESMFEMGNFNSADDLRQNFTSLTIQTSPELAQQVIDYIRANPDPSTWTAVGPNCSTQVFKILQKFKLARKNWLAGHTPKLLWKALSKQYNPGASNNPQNGKDYGQPRTDMFNAMWLRLLLAPPDNSTVTTTQGPATPCGGNTGNPCPK